MSTLTCCRSICSNTASLTALSSSTFFKFCNHGSCTDMQDFGDVTHSTPVECHINNLLFDNPLPSWIKRIENKGASLVRVTATKKSLFPFCTFTIFDNGFIALKMRTNYREPCHRLRLQYSSFHGQVAIVSFHGQVAIVTSLEHQQM